jgi:hypothetical protein
MREAVKILLVKAITVGKVEMFVFSEETQYSRKVPGILHETK